MMLLVNVCLAANLLGQSCFHLLGQSSSSLLGQSCFPGSPHVLCLVLFTGPTSGQGENVWLTTPYNFREKIRKSVKTATIAHSGRFHRDQAGGERGWGDINCLTIFEKVEN